jgi:hypothetical protein
VRWDAEYLEERITQRAGLLRGAAGNENLSREELHKVLRDAEEELMYMLKWVKLIKEKLQ